MLNKVDEKCSGKRFLIYSAIINALSNNQSEQGTQMSRARNTKVGKLVKFPEPQSNYLTRPQAREDGTQISQSVFSSNVSSTCGKKGTKRMLVNNGVFIRNCTSWKHPPSVLSGFSAKIYEHPELKKDAKQ